MNEKTTGFHKLVKPSVQIRGILYCLVCVSFAILSGNADGANDTWTGATDAYWNDSNWTGGNNPPVAGDSLTFTNTGTLTTLYDNLSHSTTGTFNTITYSSVAPAYTFWGNAITLTGGITNSSSNTQTINDALAVSSSAENFTGNIVLNGALSGSGSINVGGTLTLNGGASQSTMNINGGTLNVGAGGLTLTNSGGFALQGTGTITSINGGILTTNSSNPWIGNNAGQNLVINAVIASTVINTNGGSGTLTLGAANIGSGNFDLSTSETVKLTNSLALQNFTLAFNGSNNIVFDSSVASSTFILGGLSSNSNGTGNFALQNNAGTPAAVTIVVGNNNSANKYSGVMSGAGSFVKIGAATETLTGANTYTGNTVVEQGQLSLDLTSAAGIINSTASNSTTGSSLVMGGTTAGGRNGVSASFPTLYVLAANSISGTEYFNGTTLNAGASNITASGQGTGTMTVALGAITHNRGGTVNFTSENNGGVGVGNFTTSNSNDASGILGGWAVIDGTSVNSGSSSQNATGYAAVSSGTIVAYTGYNVVASSATLTSTTSGNGSSNVLNDQVTAAGSISLSIAGTGTTTDINTLSLAGTATGATTVSGSGILRLGTNGGLLTTNGSGNITISTGTLTAGGAANTAGEINMIGFGNGYTINSVIADNGTGAVTLTISQYGNQSVVLGGNNTYTGGTYINAGRVQANSFGTGTVTVGTDGQAYLGGGTYNNAFNIAGNLAGSDSYSAIRFNGGQTIAGTLTLDSDATITVRNSTGNFVTGQITGNYNFTIGDTQSSDGGSITLSNSSNNWGGNLTLNADKLIMGASNVLPGGSTTGNVLLTNSSNSVIEMNGFSDTINAITIQGSAGVGGVQNTTGAASTLSVGNNGGNFTYSGFLRDGAGNGSNGDTLKLDKVGGGIFVIGNTATGSTGNDYTGGTQIDGGTLQLIASAPSTILGSTSGALTVNTGTLDLNSNNLTVGALGGTGGTILSTGTATVALTASSAGTSTYTGVLQNGNSSALSLIKSGTGTLDLAGSNVYTGTTNILAGTLELGNGGSVANLAGLSFGSSTSVLALGDANGANNLTLTAPIMGSTSTNAIVNGNTLGNSTVTLSTATTASYVNAFGGSGPNQNNLNVTIGGGGVTSLSGVSTYTGATTVNGGSTLNLTGVLGATAVTVNSSGVLEGSGNGTSGGLDGGSLIASAGSAVKLTAGSNQLKVAGSATLGASGAYLGNYATLTYTLGTSNAAEFLNTGVLTANNAYINITNPTQTGTFTLADYTSLTAGYDFSLSSTVGNVTTENVGLDTLTLTVSSGSLTLSIIGAATPGVAYFDGQVDNVWSDTNTATPPTNWSTNLAGTADAGNIPGASTDVILNANNATGSRTETLGASTTINSLNVNGNGTTTLGNPGDTTSLTINALADTNTATDASYTGNTAGLGIQIGSSANAFTVNVPVILGNSQKWTNTSGNLFTVSGSVTGVSETTSTLTLSNTGAGGTTISGTITNGTGSTLALAVNNSGAGVTTLSGSNTYSGGSILNDGTLTSAVAGGFGAGNVTVNPTGTTNSAVDNATLNTNGSIASTAAVTVNSEASDGGFGIGTINFNGSAPMIASLSGNGDVVLNNATATTLTIGNSSNLNSSFSGVISNGSGSGNLVKSGTGILLLSGINTYNGTTSILAGTLQLGNASALPSNTLSGGSNLNIAGTLDLNSYSITLGSVATGVGFITNGSAGSNTSTLTIASTGTLLQTLTDSNNTTAGTGMLELTVSGGTLTINSANTYTGGTTVGASGALSFSNATSLGTGTITDNGILIINQNGTTIANALAGSGIIYANNLGGGGTSTTLSGNMSAFTGTLNIGTGGGKLALTDATNGQQISSSATVDILSGGTLFIGTGLKYGSSLILNGGSTGEGLGQLRMENGTVWSGSVTLAANTTIGGNNNNASISGVISDGGLGFGFTKLGSEVLTLSGANTFSGQTQVSQGSLLLLNTNALQDSTVNSNGFTVSGGANQSVVFDSSVTTDTFTFGGLTGTGTLALVNNAATPQAVTLAIGNNNTPQTFSGVLTGIGGLEVVGTSTQTLTGTNVYTGTTTVNAGTLAVGNGTSGSINGSTAAVVGSAGTLSFDEANGSTFSAPIDDSGLVVGNEGSGITNTLAGPISDVGAFTQNGAGTTIFGMANSYQGATSINTGTLQLGANGAIGSSSTVFVGNGTATVGTLAIGSYSTTVAGLTLNGGTISGTTGTLTSLSNFDLQSGTVSAILGGSGTTATIDGDSVVTLSGANTFTGITTVTNNSIVNYQNGTAFGGNSAIVEFSNGATVQVQGNIAGGSQTLTLRGTGNSSLGGTGALENVSGSNSYAGNILLAGNSTITSDSGTLTLTGGVSLGSNHTLTVKGAGFTTIGTGGITGTGSSGVTENAAGSTLTLTGSNSYSGATTVIAGMIQVGNGTSGSISNSSAASISSGASLGFDEATGGSYNGNISDGGTIVGNEGNGITNTLGGRISGGGSFQQTGPGATVLTGSNSYGGGTTVANGLLLMGNASNNSGGSATGSGALAVNGGATVGGYGTSSGSSFSIAGTGTATSARANVLVGMNSAGDTNTSQTLTLLASATSTITNANLTFNLNATKSGALDSDPSSSGTELSVGNTNVSFGTGTGSVQLTLNLQNEPAIVPAYTPYVLIAGTGVTTDSAGMSGGQYSGLTLGTVTTISPGVTETLITGNNLQLAFGSSTDSSYYANSYLVLYENSNTGVDNIDVEVVPEPGTWALMLGGLAMLVFWQRAKRRI
jgi:fibronectin-binding autotransporter adhesin